MAGEIEYRIGSVEYVRAEVSSKTRTGLELVAMPVSIARVAKGTKPVAGDFSSATWESSPGGAKAVARKLFTHDTAGTFDIYTKHTDTPETPVKLAGQIKVV